MNLVVGSGAPAAGMLPCASVAIRMRVAQPADRSFAMSMVPRLVASSPARWRNPRKACQACATAIEGILEAARPDSALLIGEWGHVASLGLVLLSAASNCYTHERQGYLMHEAVAEAWQALFAPLALTRAASAWARSRGYIVLMPDEFRIGHPATALCLCSEPSARMDEPLDAIPVEARR